jgi:hypothetical protein
MIFARCRFHLLLMSVFVVCVAWTHQSAVADSFFDHGYMVRNFSNGSDAAKESMTELSLNLNYDVALSGKFFVGGKVIGKFALISSGADSSSTRTFFAPAVNVGLGGDSGWRAAVFVAVSPTESVSGTFTFARYGGIGYGAEVSHLWKVGSSAFGPKLSWQMESSTGEYDGETYQELPTPRVYSRVEPYFAFVTKL